VCCEDYSGPLRPTPACADAIQVTPAGSSRDGARDPAPHNEQALRRRLGEVLVEQGVLTARELDQTLIAQSDDRAIRGARTRLGQLLVERGLATEQQVATALGGALGLPVVDLSATVVDTEEVRRIPHALAERLGVLVLGSTDAGLRVAAVDPTNVLALDDVRLQTGERTLDVVVATPSAVRAQLERAWSLSGDPTDAAFFVEEPIEDIDDLSDVDIDMDQSPAVRLVAAFLADAVRAGASDVHVEPQIDGLRIRFRVDGLLRDVMLVARTLHASVSSRLKILSGLDIAERRVPQDGRTRITVGESTVDVRVSTLPTIHGEKVVLRLLPTAGSVTGLDGLGLEPAQFAVVRTALERPQGLVLITGPTGSGKTNTLYSAIAEVLDPERNVVTLEDPVEIQLPGITQVQVNERTGMTFARGLRAVLRQDPDVVLVGEIRDLETAELAMRAALTGHLVLATLHTNAAASAPARLVDMGIAPFLVATALDLVVAQRLLRRPCPACTEPQLPDEGTLAALGLTLSDLADAKPVAGRGCVSCAGSGYRGRTGVFELLSVTPAVRRALLAGATENQVLSAAGDSYVSLRDAGIAAAAAGRTTYEEALRGTRADAYRDQEVR
jgi:type IV pilus assembly protein PilB